MIVRKAFTLMELMIVVGIIAVLASMAFPAFSIIKRQANQLKCSNNLKQIALALEVYRQDHNDEFPWFLRAHQSRDTNNTANIESMELPAKIFLCPFDKKRGMDPKMGRRNNWPDYSYLHEVGSSYMFEASSEPTTAHFPDSLVSYFYRDLSPADQAALGQQSWAKAKVHQQKFGNLLNASQSDNTRWGTPFAAETMPIVRCYWHYDWNAYPDNVLIRKVNNVAMGFNIFSSSPEWEKDVTPNINAP